MFTGKRRNSNSKRKPAMRRKAMAEIGDGAIWMPYCGEGLMARAGNYPPERIEACDEDAAAVKLFCDAFPDAAAVHTCRAESMPIAEHVYAMADIDPFGSPWPDVQRFLASAIRADPFHLIVTDGSIHNATVKHRPFDFDRMCFGERDSTLAGEYLSAWPDAARKWIEGLTGEPVVTRMREIKKGTTHMGYAWLTIGETPIEQIEAPSDEGEKRLCGAMRTNGEPCRKPAKANGRCRLHGGDSLPGGPTHPKWKHGRYSKFPGVGDAIEDDETLLDLRQEVRVIDARLAQLQGRIEEEADTDLVWDEIAVEITRRVQIVGEIHKQRLATARQLTMADWERLIVGFAKILKEYGNPDQLGDAAAALNRLVWASGGSAAGADDGGKPSAAYRIS